MNLMTVFNNLVGYADPAQEWLDNLIVDESNQYYIYDFILFGILRTGYAKLSEDKKYVTVLFHAHKDKWAIIKESVTAKTLYRSKLIDKNTFDYCLNQNLRNV